MLYWLKLIYISVYIIYANHPTQIEAFKLKYDNSDHYISSCLLLLYHRHKPIHPIEIKDWLLISQLLCHDYYNIGLQPYVST
jgi:hypothetical protein